MNERKNRGDRTPERRPSEGVRILRADEAQAALDAGEAAGRRPDDELRYGDVPPAPQGPRPAHRFPLPGPVDPGGAVPLPPLAVPKRSFGRGEGFDHGEGLAEWTGDPGSPAAPGTGWAAEDRTEELGLPGQPPEPAPTMGPADPPAPASPASSPQNSTPGASQPTLEPTQAAWEPAPAPAPEVPLQAPLEPGITVTGGVTDMPHWTDPPTGEVPHILAGEEGEEPDDMAAWHALGSRGMRWRDAGDDWSDAEEFSEIAGDVEPVGALDQSRSAHSDLYSFDEDFERVEAERTGTGPVLADFDDEFGPDRDPAPARATSTTAPGPARHARGGGGRTIPGTGRRPDSSGGRGDDLASRVAVGIGLIVLLIIAYAVGSKALVVLAAIVITFAAAEAYGMLQRLGFRPATLLGLVGTVGLVFGAYWKGIDALPLVLVLVFGGSMMWYLLHIVEARPLANVAVTTMAFVWVAVLGSYASLMLRAQHGKGLFLGAVVVAIAADVFAYLVGRWIGHRPLAPSISPGKTVEGFVGGLIAAIIAGAIIGKELTPWGGMRHGLVLGVIVGLLAPAGDLFESMIKRDLGVKDSGGALP
ncbi:MAG: phosphatidate cytidylyltransferase, partial [Acidimicrobiales bacterium]